jgi:hypothetical protein
MPCNWTSSVWNKGRASAPSAGERCRDKQRKKREAIQASGSCSETFR